MVAVSPREASSTTFQYSYDVFLSFRGEDTRKTFTDHLYTALTNAGIRTFRDDDELPRGENIESKLQKAIQESKISIVVFSTNYASSRWCLDELVKILEHKKNSTNHMILPVFYHVVPSQIRHQKGSFADAFARHLERLNSKNDEKKREGMEKVERWKAALSEVAGLSGMELQDGQEAKFIQNIVTEIVKKLKRSVLRIPDHLMGMEFLVSNINYWIQNRSNDVDIMVIYGMGGIGKTTIAKTVYNLNFDSFEGSSFLAYIRDASEQPNGLVRLQRQLLSDILRGRKEKIYSVEEGARKIRDVVSCKRILLVLDDVDRLDQLNAVFGKRDWFHPGSKIIITTRHKHLIKSNDVCRMYKVNELNGDESLQLFSWHAFGQEHPNEGYVEHCKGILQHCGGVPLALEVIGSFLFGKHIDIWVSQLEKLERVGDGNIIKKLRITFDGLPDNDIKNVFLHVACFFAGEDKDWAVEVLDSCDLQTTVAIEHLVGRCLLHIDHCNNLRMHQLIKDMGRYIVKQEAPDEPEKRSRLWHPKDCFSVLSDKIGTEAIKALGFDMQMFKKDNQVKSNYIVKNEKKRRFEEVHDNTLEWFKPLKRHASNFLSWLRMENNLYEGDFETNAFTRMKQLKLLKLNYVRLKGSYKEFPKELRCLCWHGFHLGSIPNDLSLERLIVLDMQYSSLKQVWKGSKFLPSLKILNLSHSKWISRTPNLSRVPNLEKLILKGCESLVDVCESIGFVEGLALLDLSDCTSLKELPRNISRLRCLEKLMISGCSSLCELPTGMRSMESLKQIDADGTRNIALIPLISREVQQWNLPGCLVSLSLKDCSLSDASFPKDFCNLPFLEYLNIDGNLIQSLPDCFKTLNMLKDLSLSYCPLLQSVEGLPSTVQILSVMHCKSLEIIKGTSNLRCIDNVFCGNLAEVGGCYKLVGIENVDKRIIKNLGLGLLDFQVEDKVVEKIKVLYEYGIFSTLIEGKELVESWFDYIDRSGSRSVSFIVPDNSSSKKRRIRGLNVCYAYQFNKRGIFYNRCKISNTTKDLRWIYDWGTYQSWTYEDGIVLSHWRLGNLLEVGDHLTVEFPDIYNYASIEIKEIGLKVVYDEDDDDERKEATTSQLDNLNNHKKNKEGIVTLSWTEDEGEEERNSHVHLSDCRLSGTPFSFGRGSYGSTYLSITWRWRC